VDVPVLHKHVQAIKCDIKLGSVERSGDVKNETISDEIQGIYPQASNFERRCYLYYFFNGINSISEA
jgi:hypothetical protein